MKQAIIFGGAFNPPSRGHVWILGECARIARETGAELWIMPSGERRDKRIGQTRQTRIELCKAMIADAKTDSVETRVITKELDRKFMVETADTVKDLQITYPNYHFRWVFGADSYATMHEWRGGLWLLDELDMIIVTRNGMPIEPRPNVKVLHGIDDDVSSTQIRQTHARGNDLGTLVTPSVKQVLVAHEIRYTDS